MNAPKSIDREAQDWAESLAREPDVDLHAQFLIWLAQGPQYRQAYDRALRARIESEFVERTQRAVVAISTAERVCALSPMARMWGVATLLGCVVILSPLLWFAFGDYPAPKDLLTLLLSLAPRVVVSSSMAILVYCFVLRPYQKHLAMMERTWALRAAFASVNPTTIASVISETVGLKRNGLLKDGEMTEALAMERERKRKPS